MNPAILILRGAIRVYQWFVSPLLGVHCRHWPSCSRYALEAIETHGALRGSWLALTRVLRCNPWGTWGYDPVPEPAESRPISSSHVHSSHSHLDRAEHRHG